MFQTILVPLDGSAFAEHAIPLALALSDRLGGAVHLVTVQDPVPALDPDLWEPAAHEWAANYLERTVRSVEAATGRQVVSTVLRGPVEKTLNDHASELSADLVVMSTHGRGALSRFWLGSVADEVVRHGRVPVLLVRPTEEAVDLHAGAVLQDVLVPLDGSELAERALPLASEIARAWAGSLSLLRIVPYPDEVASTYLPHTVQYNQEVLDRGRRLAADYLDATEERLRAEGAEVATTVDIGTSPASGVLHHLDDNDVDLVVLATHGHGGLTRALLGSVADKVIRASPCPVVVVRPAD